MILADAQPETWLQVAVIVVTAVVGAWTTVRVTQVDRAARRHRRRTAAERKRCDELEERVTELETALEACLKRQKPRPGKPRRKG